MDHAQNGSGLPQPVCIACTRKPDAEPKTFYVHLQDGSVQRVEGVMRQSVTQTDIILHRGDGLTVAYARADVYYACCNRDMPPPQC